MADADQFILVAGDEQPGMREFNIKVHELIARRVDAGIVGFVNQGIVGGVTIDRECVIFHHASPEFRAVVQLVRRMNDGEQADFDILRKGRRSAEGHDLGLAGSTPASATSARQCDDTVGQARTQE